MLQTDRKFYAPHPYTDAPQPIGHQQTISAPHMHAEACERLLSVLPEDGAKILDVGCGSGYLTAGDCFCTMLCVLHVEMYCCFLLQLLLANSTRTDSDGHRDDVGYSTVPALKHCLLTMLHALLFLSLMQLPTHSICTASWAW
jgi:Protein-L-isoaspartate(D-aspartate) O-methyltransferase (PCMT)